MDSMDLLTFSQMLFYLTASVAIIVLSVLIGLSTFYFLKTIKNISEISTKLNAASDEIKSKISSLFEKIAGLFSFFINKKGIHKKGRKTN